MGSTPHPPPSPSYSYSMGGPDDDTAAASDEDFATLRRLTQSFGATKTAFVSADGGCDSDTCSDADGSASDDIAYLRQLQEQFLVTVTASSSSSPSPDTPPMAKPFRALPPPDTDDEEDFEILRAIQRRFAHYECEATRDDFSPEIYSAASAETSEYNPQSIASRNVVMNEEQRGQSHIRLCQAGKEVNNLYMFPAENILDLPMAVSESASVLEPTDTYLRKGTANREDTEQDNPHLNHAGVALCSLSVRQFMSSKFPKSVHNFVDALKKNRVCQRFIRDKLIEIEAKIEANKKLKERIKCLMDFHTAYRRKLCRSLCQKRDPRVRLILLPKRKSSNKLKEKCKKGSALYFAPAENPQVSNYEMVMTRSPFSIRKNQWSNTEKDNLAKGIKQQYQEMLFLNSMNIGSELEGSLDSIIMSTFTTGDNQVTPEILRSFLPLVNWDRLSSMYLPRRSGPECESRWLNHDDPMINHDPWTLLEDKKLLFTVQERGLYNWIDIAITLGTHRTPFQCLARYQRSLNPHILNREWTNEEDAKLHAAVDTFGDNNWQIVASNLDGRTSNQCSIRWRNSLLPERKRIGRWSVEEDKRLKVSVILFGAKNWKKIALFIPGRTQSQCRERWLNCLDPSLNLESWTEEEDVKLLAAMAEHGHSWSKVAACVPRRTDNQCRRRWKILLPHEVPMLKAAQQLKRTVLISNFVGRESERPAIGPSDFTPIMSYPAPDSENYVKVGKKRSRKQSTPGSKMKAFSEKRTKKARNKLTRSPEEKSSENCITPSLADAFARMSLVSSENASEIGSFKRRRKRLSSKPSKSRSESRSDIEEQSAVGSLVNTTAEAAPSNLLPLSLNSYVVGGWCLKGTRKNRSSKPSKSRSKSRSDIEEQSAVGSLVNSTAEAAPSNLLPLSLNSYVVGGWRLKGTRKNRSSITRMSRAKSSSELQENSTAGGLVNNSAEVAQSILLQPYVTSYDVGSGRSKGARKNKLSSPRKMNAIARSDNEDNCTAGGLVNTRDEAAPTNLLPPVKSYAAGSGSSKGARKNKSRVSQSKRCRYQQRSQLDEVLASSELTEDALMELPLVKVTKLLSRAMHGTSEESLTEEIVIITSAQVEEARLPEPCVPSFAN